jgi:uncharacterized protein (TIGR00725 family)
VPVQVAVCGPRHCTDEDKTNAYQVGRLLAQAGAVVICGGGTGVMAAVAAGTRADNGLVIGVRPNDTTDEASPDLSAVIVTNMGEARNAIIVWSADAVIAIGGSWGTLSEIALAKTARRYPRHHPRRMDPPRPPRQPAARPCHQHHQPTASRRSRHRLTSLTSTV